VEYKLVEEKEGGEEVQPRSLGKCGDPETYALVKGEKVEGKGSTRKLKRGVQG